jgi:hypothetical protein
MDQGYTTPQELVHCLLEEGKEFFGLVYMHLAP